MQKEHQIVIADDDCNVRQTLKDILKEKGYSVETMKDGYEVLTYLKEKSLNLLILDLMMPEKNGIEILSTIKGISPDSKIIIYTGFREYENSMYATMADKFLLKDNNPEKLLQAITELT